MELPEHWRACRTQGIAYFVNIKNNRITCSGWDATYFGFYNKFTRENKHFLVKSYKNYVSKINKKISKNKWITWYHISFNIG
jgi:hypothetical protein